MHKHRDFFLASQDAHYHAYFVYFGQLFDGRADVSSITNYLKAVKSNTEPERFRELTSRHLALTKRAAPLLKIRHTRVAHVNATLSEDDVFVPLKITWNQIRDTIY